MSKGLQDLATTKAFRSVTILDTAYCPYCNAENDNLAITEVLDGCTTVKNSTDYETDKANAKVFECTCWECGKTFRVDYFKEV